SPKLRMKKVGCHCAIPVMKNDVTEKLIRRWRNVAFPHNEDQTWRNDCPPDRGDSSSGRCPVTRGPRSVSIAKTARTNPGTPSITKSSRHPKNWFSQPAPKYPIATLKGPPSM